MTMQAIDLSGGWTLRFGAQQKPASRMAEPEVPESWEPIPACVPGNVELDLIRSGLLPEELEKGHTIYRLRDLEANQWWYSRTFDVPEAIAAARSELVLEGVDTLATVWLNGVKIGDLENMLIPHRLEASGLLRPGGNTLVIGIDSTVLAARDRPIDPGEFAMENNWESLGIRKAAHSFGWDIMPRVVSAGIWRGVSIQVIPATRFRSVYLATTSVDASRRAAQLLVRWDLAAADWPGDDGSVRLTVATLDGKKTVCDRRFPVLSGHGRILCDLEDIDLWWPRGSGEANLYAVRLELLDGQDNVRTAWMARHGFRTVRLKMTETTDAAGSGEFAFEVNGEKIFIKGTNWVPLDALHSRDANRLEETMDMIVDLNCNMIRCWGGNVYEPEAFFRRCDEAGIMVWQDFAFACALYPQTPEFHVRVRKEAEAIIPMLRNHPSLVLWAGNNEIDVFYTFAKPHCDPNVDDQISREILASACRRLDPCRDYLPSSPYISAKLWSMGTPHERRPEDHLWGPRDDFKGNYYLSSNAHFASEIGYHGCPSRSSLERMMTPGNLWPWQGNEEWLTHAARPQPRGTAYNYRIELMANQIKVLFGEVPENLDDFVFASQVSQAEALKFFVERFRIAKGRRSGILWWNLRDGWPLISDAVVDYYGARKRAYEVIRRVQADICVMFDEPAAGAQAVVAVNDTLRPAPLEFTIRDGDAVVLSGSASIESNGRKVLGRVPACAHRQWIEIEYRTGGRVFRNHYLAGPRPFEVKTLRAWYARAGLD
ncbi:MAG: hypothetical protein R3F07_15720 [Opitutaceae bacterium]